MKVGIHVPTVSAGPLPPADAYQALFQAAEDLGFDSLWTEDRVLHEINILDSFAVLTWASACTRRIRLGTAVLLLAFREPVLLARAASTLSHLSGGRLALGVSLGGRETEYQALGVPMQKRVARFRENVGIFRALLRGEPVTLKGRFHRMEAATVRPAATVPLVFGGRAEGVLRRVAEIGDGWIASPAGGPEEFRAAWTKVLEHARARGRDPAGLEGAKFIYACVDEDVDRARRTLQAFLRPYYGAGYDVDQRAVFGPPHLVASRLREYVGAGVQTLILGVPTLDTTHLERLAREVVPALA